MTRNLKFFILSFSLVFFSLLFFNNWSQKIEISFDNDFYTAQITGSLIKDLDLDFNVFASAAIISEINQIGNQKIHFQKLEQAKMPIASITKLMTALVVLENPEIYQKSMPIVFSKKAVSQVDASRYKILDEGKVFSLETLLNMILIESNNAAAYALAEVMGESAFVTAMNLKAKEIGMENTFFVNSVGLDGQNGFNYSTVYDLTKLATYVFQNYPEIFEISKKQTYHVFDINNEFYYFIPENTNQLLYEIPEILGGKTGWTPRAGQSLLFVFSHPKKDHYFVGVLLNSQDRFRDAKQVIQTIYDGS